MRTETQEYCPPATGYAEQISASEYPTASVNTHIAIQLYILDNESVSSLLLSGVGLGDFVSINY